MKKLLLLLFLSFSLNGFSQNDEAGCDAVEPTYLTRMPGFFIQGCQHSEYGNKTFYYTDLNSKEIERPISGIYTWIAYSKIESETRKFSGEQIKLNFTNAVKKAKGECLSVNNDFFKVKANGREVYFCIEDALGNDDQGFSIYIVEIEAMQQDIVANLDEAIDKDGKVALYGILFDVGKSDIKPESAEALKQITDYLTANPAVKIIVVGHTDNTGTYAGNMTLSKARAESIKNYLINTGKISSSRLMSEGVGQVCPVTTNANEEGRKQNRRVEIVKQ